jgi:CHAT domain-containing protein
LTAAVDYHQRALAINNKLAPNSLTVAASLSNLALVPEARGDWTVARDYHQRALTIRETLAPNSLDVAVSLYNLGNNARRQGDLTGARDYLQRALAIRERLAPNSLSVAESLGVLATIVGAEGDLAGAARETARAWAIVQAQAASVVGDEARQAFESHFEPIASQLVGYQVALGKTAEAFATLEQRRARSLLTMLAERELLFTADLPPDLARERKLINADYDRTQTKIASLNPAKDQSEIDMLLAKLRELRDKREAIAQQIRKASPRFAALQYPQPLDVAGTQAVLDPGTVLLSYWVTKETTFLFVVQPVQRVVKNAAAVSVFTIPLGQAALREQVTAFRNVIQRPARSGDDAGSSSAAMQHGARLFEQLIAPAERFVAAANRVLISPDGPLHSLPFAALVDAPTRAVNQRRGSAERKARYFIEAKPLHTIVSATVYAELKKARPAPPTPTNRSATTLVAFGDPQYPAGVREANPQAVENTELRAMRRRGYELAPLPASRIEVETIAALYGDRASKYLGVEATEERAKTIGMHARYLHFATHGLVDERFPLNSALALTIPEQPAAGQDNGLLQSWEIFEHLRIDADLVTLSACETALGKEMGGEGLIGLTRAFQYAGARSVLASLWSVADESTADLMTRFYRYLKAGQSKDAALRRAQLDLLRRTDVSHPFHWAAFTLSGDWR